MPTSNETDAASAPTLPIHMSTRRLKPLRQQTKHGRVEITGSDGHVILDFLGDRQRMVVTGDGSEVGNGRGAVEDDT